ncbi:hypothetical protein F4703DRAFT_1871566 [Phycomyces blakesleeanus]
MVLEPKSLAINILSTCTVMLLSIHQSVASLVDMTFSPILGLMTVLFFPKKTLVKTI